MGGHNGWGKERAPLDIGALANFAKKHVGEYFAISSLYSPRNPSHEIKAAETIKDIGCAGLTCGHEIAHSKLNSVKRTVTSFLNSSLMQSTKHLIHSVKLCAEKFDLDCPLMFLRSDSSLVSGEWCARFPIETIFSGPAASMRGAAVLDDIDKGAAIVADMGGTSTDIGLIREGRPVFSEEGASIGSYQTMIPSLEIYSAALGGDSLVCVDGKSGALIIGPQRVVPAARGGASCAYTPTDALCTLGLYDGNKEASCIASETLGKQLGLSAAEFASAVRNEVSTRLEALFAKKCSSTGMKKICVGAPAAAYVEKAADIRVPHGSGVASAVGAAASSLSLSCSVAIIHSFFDDLYYAFLPDAKLCAPNVYEITEKSKARLDVYLRRQSQLMGIEKPHVSITEEREYIGKEQNEKSIAKITITGEAVVQNI
ncbi:MAG: hydantoinase/oxoprolinase family protein [Cloacibacillus sp.]